MNFLNEWLTQSLHALPVIIGVCLVGGVTYIMADWLYQKHHGGLAIALVLLNLVICLGLYQTLQKEGLWPLLP